jgi:D-serine deaminase-like pyridoxal phosphate-dependent protein
VVLRARGWFRGPARLSRVSSWAPPGGVPATPAVLVDEARLDQNLLAMAGRAAGHGLALRPHAKTHKSVEIARRQLGHGAAGISVATLGEAETFADAGLAEVFVAYPLWIDRERAPRLRALAGRIQLMTGVDSLASVHQLAEAVRGHAELRVLVEVDCGLRRSGVAPAGAGQIATAAARAGLAVDGVFTFPGHSYAPGMPVQAAADEAGALSAAADSLAAAGLPCPVRSGGSTPSAGPAISAAGGQGGGALTELRPGVYAFNDAQQVVLGSCTLDEVALSVLATVVSTPAPDRFVLDAGAKVLGYDRPAWTPGHGLLPAFPEATVTGLWEHHAVAATGSGPRPAVGDRVVVIPNHVCTTVNLVSELHVVRDGQVTGRWPVDARGRNS